MQPKRAYSEHVHFSGHEKINAVLRTLKGESAEAVSSDLGVSTARLERWKNDFLSAGSAELTKRKDLPKRNWFNLPLADIQQWVLFLVTLALIISGLVYFQNRP